MKKGYMFTALAVLLLVLLPTVTLIASGGSLGPEDASFVVFIGGAIALLGIGLTMSGDK